MIPAFPALATALALILYIGVFVAVGRARLRCGIKAPAVTGAPEFERIYRVQQNTVEQLIWFVPSLWLFALYASSLWAGIIGLVWTASRAYYAVSYVRDPEARGPGFGIAFICASVLLLGAIIGIAAQLL